MGTGIDSNTPSSEDIYAEIAKRKEWFFECQVRRLNLAAFREVTAKGTDSLFDLVGEYLAFTASPAPIGTRLKGIEAVYLDNRQPVWTDEIKDQKNVLRESLLGTIGDWLDFKHPVRVIAALAELKKGYEQSAFCSESDAAGFNKYGRMEPSADPDFTHAISRMAIIQNKPWLIPEIFGQHYDGKDKTPPLERWLHNGEVFISDFENELVQSVGLAPGRTPSFSPDNTPFYGAWIKSLLDLSLTTNTSGAVKTAFLDIEKTKEKILEFEFTLEKFKYNIKIETNGYKLKALSDYPLSGNVKYWITACNNSVLEVYLNQENSDMGLCLLIRALYLYGTLPASMGTDDQLVWRKKNVPGTKYQEFFSKKMGDPDITGDLKNRLLTMQAKLKIILEQTSANPRNGLPGFSPLAQEIIKQSILRYKFWLDEPFRAYDNDGHPGDDKRLSGINKARSDNNKGKPFQEMEYWSENHYIMFASSEYLAGQLWENEHFQPARDFLKPGDKSGRLTGKQRMERGKARTLKWLNNRLMFGWMEFNSSGYYREHLYALFNLVDFALDKEVREKAKIVTDLLLFDVTRLSHKGSAGAAGGRSQFKFKNCGWDGALGDVLEMAFGSRGAFLDFSGEIGCYFGTSGYKIPEVLLEIGTFPPNFSFTDRSRVSITFEEASKYGIDYSQKSDQRDSLFQGFAPKRNKQFKFLGDVNNAITQSHNGYGAWQDDTIFWWSASAFYNKEVARNTFKCVKDFGLSESPIFKGFLYTVVKYIMPFLEKTSHGIVGGALGIFAGGAVIPATIAGFFADDITGSSIIEEGSDDLSLLLDGSTRTRANILTYRNRDVMLSSIQNFRTGQLNFQTNVNQATLNTSVNVFTTSAFSGVDLSDIETGLLGGVVGLAVGGPLGAVVGVIGGVLANKKLEGAHLLVEEGDGPSWWTGYWALPMIVQHESAAIIAYDFTASQEQLADTQSHVWFPKNGFDQTEERRTSAYDDDNFFLSDITDIGPKGFWLFGKIVHKINPINPDLNEEGYIGVFSNQRPKWLDKDADFYSDQLEEKKDKLKTELAWDFFANKEWYVDGKNIWILQVGNKDEFGSFDNFKDRVSKAKVLLDDAGDMECSYSIPKKDGSSQTLSLKYGDGGEFSLDGQPFQTDLYPRFESPFVRGGRVEWGQREYVIEYNGKSLMHDFSNMEQPVSEENKVFTPEDAVKVKGLVIYLKTHDQEMEVFSVATATVDIGCNRVAYDEVIAAGKVDENTYHDAEWIFFDMPAESDPDMTIDIYHNLARDIPFNGDSDTEWKMTYTLKALMGDRSLKPCTIRTIPLATFYLRHKYRNTGPVAFSVQLSQWRKWKMMKDIAGMRSWMIATQPGDNSFYFDYIDVLGFDKDNILSHKKIGPCSQASSGTDLTGQGHEITVGSHFNLFPCSTRPGYLYLFLINKGTFYGRWLFPGQEWSSQPWTKPKITYQPMIEILGISVPDTSVSPIPVPVGLFSQVHAGYINYGIVTPSVCIYGADGNFYVTSKWPLDGPGNWRKIETASIFTQLPGSSFQVAGNFIFVLDKSHLLWRYPVIPGQEDTPASWELIPVAGFTIHDFKVAAFDGILQVIACTADGAVWGVRPGDQPAFTLWQRIGENIDFKISPAAGVSCVSSTTGRLDIFAIGTDGNIYTTWWTGALGWENNHNWTAVSVDSKQFKVSGKDKLASVSRVNGQVEIFATDSMQNIWKNWWS